MTVEEFIEEIKRYTKEEYLEKFWDIEDCLKNMELALASFSVEEKRQVLFDMEKKTRGYLLLCRLHILSFCLQVSGEAVFAEILLSEVRNASYDELGEYQKLYYFWQINTVIFQDCHTESPETDRQAAELYMELVHAFGQAFGIAKREYIPAAKRDADMVFVFISQVLGLNHAPTKTLLDRCYVLKKYCGKKVCIINTAMQITKKGMSPFYKMKSATYDEQLSEYGILEFRGEKFSFFQCPNRMPDLEIMAELILRVKREKPMYILNIGGSDICADLCGMLAPEITVSTVFSKTAVSCGEYQMVDKELTKEDRTILGIFGVDSAKVKRTRFTFVFKEQGRRFTRQQLGLPEDKFILIIMGWRLDEEIDDRFLKMLDEVIEQQEGIVAAFMGKFDTYKERVANYSFLGGGSYYLGPQEDALAVLELCNLYVNPERNGGGSSVSEALYKGLPSVTLPCGDVSVAAGEAFWVDDYAKMQEKIQRYYAEPDYYGQMAQKAKARAELLLDSSASFAKTIKEIETELNEMH